VIFYSVADQQVNCGDNQSAQRVAPHPRRPENTEHGSVFTSRYHPPPSPSRRGREYLKPSPRAGEGRVRGIFALKQEPGFDAYTQSPSAQPPLFCPLGIFGYQRKMPSHPDMGFFVGGPGGTFLHKKLPPATFPFLRRCGHA